jgi:uncharacterized protein YkwD
MHAHAPSTPYYRHVAATLLAAVLAACGGGGGGHDDRDDRSNDDVEVADCGLPDFRATVLARVNEVRAAGVNCGAAGTFGPAGALAWNDLLAQAAAAHAQDMARLNFFSHTSPDGGTLTDRVDATGYEWQRLGENLAAGHTSVIAVVDAWVASPDHCANMLNPLLTEVGVACVPGSAATTYQTYWTMELGQPP